MYLLLVLYMAGGGKLLNFRNKTTAFLAFGASNLMLSDSLLVYNKFSQALPFESFFVLFIH